MAEVGSPTPGGNVARRIGLIGVPSSAGAHWPGQERGPAALRAAGLVERLGTAGLEVTDHGDLPRVRMRPDPGNQPQNLGAVLAVARAVAERVEAMVRAGETPVVVGGDCTIELGTVAGAVRAGVDPALVYVDGGVDLRTPAENPTGILDSMGVAHLVALPGTAAELARIGPRFPLLAADRIVYLGFEPNVDGGPEAEILERLGFPSYPAARVRGRAEATATEALRDVEGRAERFLVHFDVDVIDFVDLPVADVPQINAGLTLRDAIGCLRVLASSPKFAGVTITEFNPDHGDEHGWDAATLAQGIADALAGMTARRS